MGLFWVSLEGYSVEAGRHRKKYRIVENMEADTLVSYLIKYNWILFPDHLCVNFYVTYGGSYE